MLQFSRHSNSASRSPILRLLGFLNIAAFFRWWGRGLLLWLPASARGWFIPEPAKIILEVQDDELILSSGKKNSTAELDRYPVQALYDGSLKAQFPKIKNKQFVLRLAVDSVLTRTIPLPMAAESNLRQVVGFEIDRLTPFTPEKIYYDAYVVSRNSETRGLQVKLVMVLRSVIDGFLQSLAALRLTPDVIDISGNNDSTINLLPPDKRPKRGRAAGRIQALLWILIFLSVCAAAILPLWQQRNTVLALMPQVDKAQQQAEVAVQLRTELEDTITSSQFLLQKRLQNELVIELVNELTAILPDNTWVEQLIIKDNEVQVRGQSLAAATLISLVEASEKFEKATFRSPVVEDRRTGRDRFFLTAQIRKKIQNSDDS